MYFWIDSDIPPDYSDEEDEVKCDSAPVKEEEEEEEEKPKPKSAGKRKSTRKSGKSEPAPSTSSGLFLYQSSTV